MRRRYRQVKRNGKWELVEITVGLGGKPKSAEIMPDIDPYTSMVTGEIITSRSKHRQHLQEHGLQEIGNETENLFTAYDNLQDNLDQSRHETVVNQFKDMDHKDFKNVIKRSVRQARGY